MLGQHRRCWRRCGRLRQRPLPIGAQPLEQSAMLPRLAISLQRPLRLILERQPFEPDQSVDPGCLRMARQTTEFVEIQAAAILIETMPRLITKGARDETTSHLLAS